MLEAEATQVRQNDSEQRLAHQSQTTQYERIITQLEQ